MNRITTTFALPATLALVVSALGAIPQATHAETHAAPMTPGTMHVTKSPTCGCCAAWVALAREEGYVVETTDTRGLTRAKIDAGIPGDLWSCHTARIDGYVVEGHVPFDALDRLLEERPDIAGIAVPGMPAGSPGMGDDPTARFDVVAFGGTASEDEVFYQAGS